MSINNDKESILEAIKFKGFDEIRSAVVQRRKKISTEKKKYSVLQDSVDYISAAIARGNFEAVQYLLYHGAAVESGNYSALHDAVYHSQPKMLRHMLLDVREDYLKIALLDVVSVSDNEKRNFMHRMSQYFFEFEDQEKKKNARDAIVGDVKLFMMLPNEVPQDEEAKKKYDELKSKCDELTAVTLEAFDKFHENARIINPNTKNINGQTPFDLADSCPNDDIRNYMKSILSKVTSFIADSRESGALSEAALLAVPPVKDKPLVIYDVDGKYTNLAQKHDSAALWIDVCKAQEERLKERDKFKEARDNLVKNFLDNASNGILTKDYLETSLYGKDMLSINVNSGYGNEQNTPLHLAVAGGNLDSVKLLLGHGASLTARNAQGLTPAELAKKLAKQNLSSDNLLNNPQKAQQYKEINEFFSHELTFPASVSRPLPQPDPNDPSGAGLKQNQHVLG